MLATRIRSGVDSRRCQLYDATHWDARFQCLAYAVSIEAAMPTHEEDEFLRSGHFPNCLAYLCALFPSYFYKQRREVGRLVHPYFEEITALHRSLNCLELQAPCVCYLLCWDKRAIFNTFSQPTRATLLRGLYRFFWWHGIISLRRNSNCRRLQIRSGVYAGDDVGNKGSAVWIVQQLLWPSAAERW